MNGQAKVARVSCKVEDVRVGSVWIFEYAMVVVAAFPRPNVCVGEWCGMRGGEGKTVWFVVVKIRRALFWPEMRK